MRKVFKIIIIIAFGIIILFSMGILQSKWLIADMGWCQRYGTGLKIGKTIIFKLPEKPSVCI